MNTLNLKLTNCINFKPTVLVDGKEIYFTKDNFGTLNSQVTTDKNKVEIKISKLYEFNSSKWFLWSILYFFISLLGIFDAGFYKTFYSLNTTIIVEIKENSNLKLTFRNRKNKEKAIDYSYENCEVDEKNNFYFIDNIAKKRQKLIVSLRIIFWIILVVSAIILAVTFA